MPSAVTVSRSSGKGSPLPLAGEPDLKLASGLKIAQPFAKRFQVVVKIYRAAKTVPE